MRADPTTTPATTIQPPSIPLPVNASSTVSFATNPNASGIPAIDAAEIDMKTRTGRHRPSSTGSSARSRVFAWWSMIPTPMNKAALNNPWLSNMSEPANIASSVPTPKITNRNPSWLIVPFANSALRSVGRSALNPPRIIVISPTAMTVGRNHPTASTAGESRATRYTPAFTMVAECR